MCSSGLDQHAGGPGCNSQEGRKEERKTSCWKRSMQVRSLSFINMGMIFMSCTLVPGLLLCTSQGPFSFVPLSFLESFIPPPSLTTLTACPYASYLPCDCSPQSHPSRKSLASTGHIFTSVHSSAPSSLLCETALQRARGVKEFVRIWIRKDKSLSRSESTVKEDSG